MIKKTVRAKIKKIRQPLFRGKVDQPSSENIFPYTKDGGRSNAMICSKFLKKISHFHCLFKVVVLQKGISTRFSYFNSSQNTVCKDTPMAPKLLMKEKKNQKHRHDKQFILQEVYLYSTIYKLMLARTKHLLIHRKIQYFSLKFKIQQPTNFKKLLEPFILIFQNFL